MMTCLYILCSGNIRVTWWKQSEKNFTAVSLQQSSPEVSASFDYKLQITNYFATQFTWSICVCWCDTNTNTIHNKYTNTICNTNKNTICNTNTICITAHLEYLRPLMRLWSRLRASEPAEPATVVRSALLRVSRGYFFWYILNIIVFFT